MRFELGYIGSFMVLILVISLISTTVSTPSIGLGVKQVSDSYINSFGYKRDNFFLENDTMHTVNYTTYSQDFSGYDPFIHSMINETNSSNIYDDIDTLQSFKDDVTTRTTGTLGFEQAVSWVYDRFDSFGLDVYLQEFDYEGAPSWNVIAVHPGTDPELEPETFIIGGHLDSINSDDGPAPGADDNGSGIALVLETARIISQHQFERTIRFAAWGAEEQGLIGSKHYVSNIDEIEEKVMGYMNYDMLGYTDTDLAITVHANTASNWMLDYKSDVSDAYDNIGINFTYEYNSTLRASDHDSFWKEDYNATLSIETLFRSNPYYHTENDTLDKLTIPQITHTTRHAIATLAHLAVPVMLTFDIPLIANDCANGWNFVSFNIDMADTSIENILTDIDGSYDRVMYYDASADQWSSYVPGRANHFNNLHSWDKMMGIWIKMNTDATLNLTGYAPTSTDITLYPEWNMVGLPSASAENHGLPTEVTRIGHFEATEEYNLAYDYDPGNYTFESGNGYWLYLDHTQRVVWTVDY